jgi:hypothetical protein
VTVVNTLLKNMSEVNKAEPVGQWGTLEDSIFLNQVAEVLMEEDQNESSNSNAINEGAEGVVEVPSVEEPDATDAALELSRKLNREIHIPAIKRALMAQIETTHKIQEAEAQGIRRPKYKDPAAEDYKIFLKSKEMERKKEEERVKCLKDFEKMCEEYKKSSEVSDLSPETIAVHEKNVAMVGQLVKVLPHLRPRVPPNLWENTRANYNAVMRGSYDQPADPADPVVPMDLGQG